MTSATVAYRAARDHLLGLRGQQVRAIAEFRWPDVGEQFNWADRLVRRDRPRQRPHRAGDRRGGRLAAPSAASTRWPAAPTRSPRGSRRRASARATAVMLMLGNQVELWESMLAVMKLGAVIMPTTHRARARRPGRPDRPRRRAARHRATPRDAPKFDDVPGDYVRIAVGAGRRLGDLRGRRTT